MKALFNHAFLLVIALLIGIPLFGQGVAINESGEPANSKAILDLSASDKGLLIPRMSSEIRENFGITLTEAEKGMLVFDSTSQHLYYWSGDQFVKIEMAKLEDQDKDTRIDVELTPDDDEIRFFVGGAQRWKMKDQSLYPLGTGGSVFIGENAGLEDDGSDKGTVAIGRSALASSQNRAGLVAIGDSALYKNAEGGVGGFDGNWNTAVGSKALRDNVAGSANTSTGYGAMHANTSGDNNTATGTFAMALSTTGNNNVATGALALSVNTDGSDNVAIGHSALSENTSGNGNVAIGRRALDDLTEGNANVAIGLEAMQNVEGSSGTIGIGHRVLFNAEGRDGVVAIGDSVLYRNGVGAEIPYQGAQNTAIGSKAMYANTLGTFNTATGADAMKSNVDGSSNAAFGMQALRSNTSGNNNVATGASALRYNTSGSFNVAAGHSAMFLNTTGEGNVAIGRRALYDNTTGNHHVAVGEQALRNLETGDGIIGIGYKAMYNARRGSGSIGIGDSVLYNNGYGNDTASYFGIENVAIGRKAMYENQNGWAQVAVGSQALLNSTEGNGSVGIGFRALWMSTSSTANVAIGSYSLGLGEGGYQNIGIGASALKDHESGTGNIAIGIRSLENNETGIYNVAIGFEAQQSNFEGSYNVALGGSTFEYDYYSGNCNTAVGYGAGGAYYNATSLGYDAFASDTNHVRIGNYSVESIGGSVSWSNLSDGRFKRNIQENVAGLDFIKRLRPVTYNFDVHALFDHKEARLGKQVEDQPGKYNRESTTYTGFIAQEVEQAAEEVGFEFSGVDKPSSDENLYAIRYAEFVVPLVKAVQEQQQMIEDLQARIAELERDGQ